MPRERAGQPGVLTNAVGVDLIGHRRRIRACNHRCGLLPRSRSFAAMPSWPFLSAWPRDAFGLLVASLASRTWGPWGTCGDRNPRATSREPFHAAAVHDPL